MVKIEPVNGQSMPIAEKAGGGTPGDYRRVLPGKNDPVMISEEGKKKHISGRLRARIADESATEGRLKRKG